MEAKRQTRGGQLLAKAMADKGLRQEDVAKRVSVTQPAVSFWLRGTWKPDAELRRLLQRKFGVAAEAWDEIAA